MYLPYPILAPKIEISILRSGNETPRFDQGRKFRGKEGKRRKKKGLAGLERSIG
jgi:hypothetical protein